RLLVLLGDYGTGKTTSCRRLFYDLALVASREGFTGRIPLYIPLQEYYYTNSSEGLITKFLSEHVSSRIAHFQAFDAMNGAGLFVLILDGFDEMARRVTRKIREDSFHNIGKLLTTKGKLIVSGRPGYFPDQEELVSACGLAYSRAVPHQGTQSKR